MESPEQATENGKPAIRLASHGLLKVELKNLAALPKGNYRGRSRRNDGRIGARGHRLRRQPLFAAAQASTSAGRFRSLLQAHSPGKRGS
jgi:hypothetical protein